MCQINPKVGDIFNNKELIANTIRENLDKNDLFIFPELAICGYPPLDMLLYQKFIASCHNAIQELSTKIPSKKAVIIGSPSPIKNQKGKHLRKSFNSAYVLSDGKIQTIIHKSILPNYKEFDEERYFFSGKNISNKVHILGKTILLTICEDIWDKSHPKYPLQKVENNIDFHVNISASPFQIKKYQERKDILCQVSSSFSIPSIYLNQVGANTDLIFDGASFVVNKKGEDIFCLKSFSENIFSFHFEEIEKKTPHSSKENRTETIKKALILGVRDYCKKNTFSKVLIGSSGGIDSALTACIAVKALGKEKVLLITLPSEFSSKSSVSDSQELANALGVSLHTISIKDLYFQVTSTLLEYFEGLPFSVAEENIQSRLRGLLLMAFCNKHNYVLLNTTNKSELAVGYGTLYGDLNGAISVLGDVYKTQVYELSKTFSEIPHEIITKPPSAELRPDQKDTDSLPEYTLLDEILKEYIEKQSLGRRNFTKRAQKRTR